MFMIFHSLILTKGIEKSIWQINEKIKVMYKTYKITKKNM